MPTDPVVWTGAIVIALLSAVHVFPLLDPNQAFIFAEYYSEIPLIALTLTALFTAARGTKHVEERRFWTLMSAGYASLLTLWLIYFVEPEYQDAMRFDLIADVLMLMFYGFPILAMTTCPHRVAGWSENDDQYRTEFMATFVFLGGLLTYFLLIPLLLSRQTYESYLPALLMYVVLALLVFWGFIHLRRKAGTRRWRTMYGLLAAGALALGAVDFIDYLSWLEVFGQPATGTVVGVLWYLPYVPILLAARLGSLSSPSVEPEIPSGPALSRHALLGPLGLFVFALPIIHLGSSASGLLDASTRTAREVSVFACLLLLAGMAATLHGKLEAKRRQDEQELQRQGKQLRALIERLAGIQEEERRAIARELHDEIGQQLTALNLSLELASRPSDGTDSTDIKQAQETVRELTRQVRDLSLDLRPSLLDDQGLVPALRGLFERLRSRVGLQVEFEVRNPAERLPAPVETAAYRIVQEALTNVLRHACVPHAAVAVTIADTGIEIRVEDAGKGFDPGALENGEGGGIVGLRERVELLQGSMTLESEPGAGTRLAVHLPAIVD